MFLERVRPRQNFRPTTLAHGASAGRSPQIQVALAWLKSQRQAFPWAHLGYVSDGLPALRDCVVQAVDQAIAGNYLAVVLHSLPRDSTARTYLTARRLDSDGLQSTSSLMISRVVDVFEQTGGRPDPTHLQMVLSRLRDAALSDGKKGVQVVCDASHAFFQRGHEAQWLAVEEWMGKGLGSQIGLLCLHRRSDMTSRRRAGLDTTHQMPDQRRPRFVVNVPAFPAETARKATIRPKIANRALRRGRD